VRGGGASYLALTENLPILCESKDYLSFNEFSCDMSIKQLRSSYELFGRFKT